MSHIYLLLQIFIMIILSPLLGGIITKIKNNLRFRKGPSVLQPYYNLIKYFSKDEVVSEHASWIFTATPYIVLAANITAAILLPFFFAAPALSHIGDLIAIMFLLSLGRFFLALAGLDPATTFGGMGSSREMFISSFVEPALLISVFAVSLNAGTSDISSIAASSSMSTAAILAIAALFLVTLTETSRIPVDNQETHLELTMIHEAMVLEYSGKGLALIELAAYVKQILFFLLISMLFMPGYTGIIWISAKLLTLCAITAVTELSLSKMRLFRVVDFLSFSLILAILAVISLVLGV
jgi:formate hydrogenlyase subunit 4